MTHEGVAEPAEYAAGRHRHLDVLEAHLSGRDLRFADFWTGYDDLVARTADEGGARPASPLHTHSPRGARMRSTVQPTIVTAHLERMLEFYSGLLGANETQRMPEEGPVFYVGLRIGNSDLGMVSDSSATGGQAGRILLSVEVRDVDALLPRVAGLGGEVTGGPTDMAWGQRVAHIKDPDGNAVNLTSPLPRS